MTGDRPCFLSFAARASAVDCTLTAVTCTLYLPLGAGAVVAAGTGGPALGATASGRLGAGTGGASAGCAEGGVAEDVDSAASAGREAVSIPPFCAPGWESATVREATLARMP